MIMRKAVTIGEYILLSMYIAAISSCGSSSSNTDDVGLANQYLESAYQDLQSGNQLQALADVNTSISYTQLRDALLLKAQIEYAMGDEAGWDATLSQFNMIYPNDGGDDFLNAYRLSEKHGDANLILSDLETALNQNYADLNCEIYWQIVENDAGFAYFREQPQYQTLEELKTCDSGLEGSKTKCKENFTKLLHHWWGLQFYLDHGDTQIAGYAASITAVCCKYFIEPPVLGWLVGTAIQLRASEVKWHDRGCGIILNWTWANFNPGLGVAGVEAFVTTKQN